MDRRRHLVILAGLLGLSCLVQVVVIRRATTTALDAVRFVGIAREIEQQGLLPTVQTQEEQPLFPAWVWVVHEGLQRVAGELPSAWATSSQLAAAIPLVLAVVPLYFALIRLVGSAAGLAGSFLFCLLPEVSRLGADGISDSTHLLFFCLAFWAMVEYLGGGKGEGGRGKEPSRRPFWLLAAGAGTAVAVLARSEVLVLAGALGVTLAVFQLLPGRRQARRNLAAGAALFVLGLAAVLGPYLAAVGAVTPGIAISRVLGRHQAEEESSRPTTASVAAVWRLPGREPMSFDVKEPSISIRQRGYLVAVVRFGKELAAAFGYWIGALALWGTWRWGRSRASAGDRFVQIFFVLFSLVAIRFSAAEGYLVPRHLLGLVVVGMGSAGYGALELGLCLAGVLPAAERHSSNYPATAWAMVVVAGVVCLPQTFVRHHHSRLGHRAAGDWLAICTEPNSAVLDTRGWTGLYSGRRTYPYEDARLALSDPRLRYLVLERQECRYDSRRGRTLRYLIETAARPVAQFPDPATRKRNQQPVAVYRWYPDRFDRHVAGRGANPQMREDRHARANRGIRRQRGRGL